MSLHIQQNVSLQSFNTMAVPAQADYLTTVTSVPEMHDALSLARRQNLPVLVLGEGSNTLFEHDYKGLVILNRLRGMDVVEELGDLIRVKVGAGENWHRWVAHSLKQGWSGLENLALIPGLVGAAPMQNIGAYGVELEQYLHSVELLYVDSGEIGELSREQCEFGYRDSVFKHRHAPRAIITAVTFELNTYFEPQITYPAVKEYLQTRMRPSQELTALHVFDAICHIRRSKLPSPREIPNSGSFFKNPVVSEEKLASLREHYPEIVSYEHRGQIKLAAAWLIERAGWKRRQRDGVQVHKDQALVITNPGRASGASVMSLARAIQEDIAKQFRIQLEIEPRIY
ncbi:MAG: UDP-N-acetylmuramate dehydrogenase [Gammaproteobacteria bacterium]|nr:UDP-N-acetylmuramate dehydrogenase [Gammaproteobacteria bacterium]